MAAPAQAQGKRQAPDAPASYGHSHRVTRRSTKTGPYCHGLLWSDFGRGAALGTTRLRSGSSTVTRVVPDNRRFEHAECAILRGIIGRQNSAVAEWPPRAREEAPALATVRCLLLSVRLLS